MSSAASHQSLLRPPTKVRNDLKMTNTGAVPVVHVDVDKENASVLSTSDFVVVAPNANVPKKTVIPAAKTPVAKAAAVVRRPATSAVTPKPLAKVPAKATTVPAKPAATSATKRPVAAVSAPTSGPAKKRPAWDIKGRLQEMEEAHMQLIERLGSSDMDVNQMMAKLQESHDRVMQLEQFQQQLSQNVIVKETEYTHISKDYEHLQQQLQSQALQHSDELARVQRTMQFDLDNTKRTLEAIERTKASVENELRIALQENMNLKAQISQQSGLLISAESEGRALRLQIQTLEESNRSKAIEIDLQKNNLSEANAMIQELENKLRADEAIRRKLHNTILELKGNIRVFCRVRPALGNENADGSALSHLSFANNDGIEVISKSESASGKDLSKTLPFTFDRVFGPETSQADVFDEISQLVQSALDGYRVCIFAYGQTGSGKTFTMEGPPKGLDNDQTRGMIPRAVYQIFEQTQKLKEKGWQYKMEVNYVEIYNETIRDLLGSGSDDDKKHEIKHNDKTGTTTVSDVRVVDVTSANQIFSLLQKASENRSVGRTQMNERSSRSHSVFSLRLVGNNSLTEEKCDGVLNLIDLAGSERINQSGATGDRLKETQAINKSLSSLADVIMALANKGSHIPYRNSKLTYLLQNSLGGNCKTLMFVNVSPLPSNAQETISSLRFAAQVNACDIGTARRVVTK